MFALCMTFYKKTHKSKLEYGTLEHTTFRTDMGLDVTKPVPGVSDKARLKPVSSATETS